MYNNRRTTKSDSRVEKTEVGVFHGEHGSHNNFFYASTLLTNQISFLNIAHFEMTLKRAVSLLSDI